MRKFRTSEQREEAIRKAFVMLDKDGSGYIEWNEIKYELRLVLLYIFHTVNEKVKTRR